MTDAEATRLSGNNSDLTRLAGESYRTRLVPGMASATDDKTRIAQQEGYQSKMARDAVNDKPDESEFYKIGDRIGDRYEVSAIHHGAMGVVYGCFDHETKLPRALKTVRSRHLQDKQVLSLFEKEAAVWISLEKHPYIVRAYLVKDFNKLPYVITEYVRGPEGMEADLRGWLGHPRLTLPVAIAMALQIAQGMQHAVRKIPNLVHRDLKPANILVNCDGKAMVTDFGLVDSEQVGAGTPAYMSPEQWRGDELDVRSDIYAYGCILFEMFTGHRLFHALTEFDWERAHLNNSPSILTSLAADLPSEIDQFVRRCLSKELKDRPRNWDEVVIFFSDWYHRLTNKSVVLDFTSLQLNGWELFDACYSLVRLDRNTEALSAIEKALELNPNDLTALNIKAVVLRQINRHEDAVKTLDQAITIDPENHLSWRSKGESLGELKFYEEAIYSLDRALEIEPSDSYAWTLKGRMLNSNHQYKEAIIACDKALAFFPDDVNTWDMAVTWYIKGNALSDLNYFSEAIEAFNRTLEIAPSFFQAWNNKGKAHYRLNNWQEASVAFDKVLEIDLNNFMALCNKALVLKKLDRVEDALVMYERALAIDPNNTTLLSHRNAAIEYLKSKNLQPKRSSKKLWSWLFGK